ncbi:MAG TPA: TPM domain-containing protein [Terriglobia bacterium]|nr:TPM domain-containing protein [Terriglobia bacterium]
MRSIRRHFKARSRCSPILLIIIFLAVIPVSAVHAEQWKNLNPQGYVNDFAGVLNATTVEKLTAVSTEVDQKSRAQIAVVTIKSLEDATVEDFANHLFQKWGVGAKGTDRGVMVLLATEDHKYWTEVGYGLEPILPDGKVGGFGRGMVPLLRQGDYNGAAVQMVSQIALVIAQDSHVSLDSLAGLPAAAPAAPGGEAQESQLTTGEIIFLAIIFIIFIIVAGLLLKFLGPWFFLSLLLGSSGRRGGGWGGGGFGGGGGGFGGFGGGSSGGGGAGGGW